MTTCTGGGNKDDGFRDGWMFGENDECWEVTEEGAVEKWKEVFLSLWWSGEEESAAV